MTSQRLEVIHRLIWRELATMPMPSSDCSIGALKSSATDKLFNQGQLTADEVHSLSAYRFCPLIWTDGNRLCNSATCEQDFTLYGKALFRLMVYSCNHRETDWQTFQAIAGQIAEMEWHHDY